jgi:D-proline reductase (dithiol) PrdB
MGPDDALASHLASLPVPAFDDPAFVQPPPLREATVAVVTTAALHHPDDRGFGPGEQSFRRIDPARRDELVLGHLSPNFDRSGMLADRNVVLPLDRLDELAASGAIGRVSPLHLSFLGAQDETMSTIRLDSGQAAAAALVDVGTDVVLLTPV